MYSGPRTLVIFPALDHPSCKFRKLWPGDLSAREPEVELINQVRLWVALIRSFPVMNA